MEIWKDIKGFEGLYQVSDFGRVKDLNGVFLKIHIGKSLYPFVRIKKQKSIPFHIHRLIAEAFIPNPLNKKQVNHKDGNKTNSTLENLEWVTCSENHRHAFDNGIRKSPMLNPNVLKKLNPVKIHVIKHLKNIKPKMSQQAVGDTFKVSAQLVGQIWLGNSHQLI